MSEAVVLAAFRGVGKHCVGLLDLLEAVFSVGLITDLGGTFEPNDGTRSSALSHRRRDRGRAPRSNRASRSCRPRPVGSGGCLQPNARGGSRLNLWQHGSTGRTEAVLWLMLCPTRTARVDGRRRWRGHGLKRGGGFCEASCLHGHGRDGTGSDQWVSLGALLKGCLRR